MGNISNRGRYESLVRPYLAFLMMIVTYLRSKNLETIAENLLKNKNPCIHYLTKNNWTLTDMNGHRWEPDFDRNQVYGKMTDSKLINTNGITINLKWDIVSICHWNQYGCVTRPRI
jgi:hypothetical protein